MITDMKRFLYKLKETIENTQYLIELAERDNITNKIKELEIELKTYEKIIKLIEENDWGINMEHEIRQTLEDNEKYTTVEIDDDRAYGLAKVINDTLFKRPQKITKVIIIYEAED